MLTLIRVPQPKFLVCYLLDSSVERKLERTAGGVGTLKIGEELFPTQEYSFSVPEETQLGLEKQQSQNQCLILPLQGK